MLNSLFPDRAKFARDPLGFLLREANGTSAPLIGLKLGFHRVHLINDLDLLEHEPFRQGPLCFSDSFSDLSLPISVAKAARNGRQRQERSDRTSIGANIIDGIIDELLIGFRQAFFAAHRQASIDCWRFSSSLATKLTFIALFGKESLVYIDDRAFSHHAELVQYYRERISLDIICDRRQQISKNRQLCEPHAREVESAILTSLKQKQGKSVYEYVYSSSYPASSHAEEMRHLVLGAQHAIAKALFWTLFAIAQATNVRSAIEKEADACLLSSGEIDKSKLKFCSVAHALSHEILRLDPSHNLLIIDYGPPHLTRNIVSVPNILVLCPYVFFRSSRLFQNENAVMLDRAYDSKLLNIHYLACGGGFIFNFVLLNLALFLLDLCAAFEPELVERPHELTVAPTFRAVRPDIKVRFNLRRSRLFR